MARQAANNTSDIITTDNLVDSDENYIKSRHRIGYVPRTDATKEIYAKLGFKCGLEIHQQLLTDKKLFCHCPAGIYQTGDDFDAELIRHMRPTLSEMGEYDGTALMEKKTRKEIVYRIKDETACTYDIDDTPPFRINQQALDIATEIAMLLNLNIVGEVHITRKQYLDGSIPTGFQRTAIVGIEGDFQLPAKKIRIIQLSIEEDSCREVSDIGHVRVYTTDRLGMPLIETVTYPDMLTPDESAEAAQYLRMLTRTTGKVRTGIGAAREDVNVSITGGTRVEIKGVSHIKWIPELTHNEAFRQRALLEIRQILLDRVQSTDQWQTVWQDMSIDDFEDGLPYQAGSGTLRLVAINLPQFKELLSFFTQPGKTFANELSDRLKVIACLERPNMIHSEDTNGASANDLAMLRRRLNADADDAQVLVWGPDRDVTTAIEVIEERCRLAFDGVPNETRKSLPDGTTLFERVLPGPDRMYPDTDSAPIPVTGEYLEKREAQLPVRLPDTLKQLRQWKLPESSFPYIITRRLFDNIRSLAEETSWSPKAVGLLFAQTQRSIERRLGRHYEIDPERTAEVIRFIHAKGLGPEMAREMLPSALKSPDRTLNQMYVSLVSEALTESKLRDQIRPLCETFHKHNRSHIPESCTRWVMGKLRKHALGVMPLKSLADIVAAEAAKEVSRG